MPACTEPRPAPRPPHRRHRPAWADANRFCAPPLFFCEPPPPPPHVGLDQIFQLMNILLRAPFSRGLADLRFLRSWGEGGGNATPTLSHPPEQRARKERLRLWQTGPGRKQPREPNGITTGAARSQFISDIIHTHIHQESLLGSPVAAPIVEEDTSIFAQHKMIFDCASRAVRAASPVPSVAGRHRVKFFLPDILLFHQGSALPVFVRAPRP